MAPGAGRGPTRRRGSKPHAHKRRAGGFDGGGAINGNGKIHARSNSRDTRGGPNGGGKRHHQRRLPDRNSTRSNSRVIATHRAVKQIDTDLQPIKVNSNGIMSAWMKPLGGLIRYYVHERTHSPYSPIDQLTAEKEVERMYCASGCRMEDTKTMILESLGVGRDIENGWIDISMVIEKDGQISNGDAIFGHTETANGKGIKLNQVLRSGEGPAHSHEQWTTIVVPDWAVSKSYFFEVKNKSPLNLSCELSLDGEKVARNAPLTPYSTGTIKPDTVRYFQRHQWILNGARKVKLRTSRNDTDNHKSIKTRYNGIRPDHAGGRVSVQLYPDPTNFGWTFTGSVQDSRVEFFEVPTNTGDIVKLDFYYTTGTIKTVLHHPTSGNNQLFRAQVTPLQYAEVMKNPRAHTGQGYRRKEDRPAGNECARLPRAESQKEAKMGDSTALDVDSNSTYYAKDDKYDFKKQGHVNRRDHMSKLHQSNDFADWKEANNKEYAVIHAKFYVSLPKKMYRSASSNRARGGFKQRRGRKIDPLPLPEQSKIMDVKAAENATLGTKYEATAPPQNMVRSFVRMERINGLKDDKEWKGDPVFEKKLYYRAESVVNGQGCGDVESDDMDDISMSENESDDINRVAETNTLLNDYKTEKIAQVKQYFSELSAYVELDEAKQKLQNTENKIYMSESNVDIDDVVKIFYSDLTHREIVDSANMNCL